MSEIKYNVGLGSLVAGKANTGSSILKAAIIITSKVGADDPDLTTMAAINAVGTVAFHTELLSLTSVTATVDQANNRVNIDAANLTFAAAPGVSALALVIYDATTDTNEGTRIPMFFYDTGFPAAMDGGLVVNIADFARVA